jgi:hypothetical protein
VSDSDDMPTPEEWRKLQAEWTHDYGLRRMEDRGVKYEDEAERELDHAAARGKGGEQDNPLASGVPRRQATVNRPGRAAKPGAEPPHPWPSEIADRNRNQPGRDHGHDKGNGHDTGHSM